MKKLITIIFCIYCLLLGCKKHLIFPEKVQGEFVNYYTKEPISGLDVVLYEIKPVLFGWSQVESKEKAKATTDNSGIFNLKVRNLHSKRTYILSMERPSFDTTQNAWKYMPDGGEGLNYFERNDLDQNIHIELKPSGYIETFFSDNTLDSLNADTFVVQSPYVQDTLVGCCGINFYVEPSKYNQFTWYYIKNGVNSAPVTQMVFVPNYFKDGSGGAKKYFFELKF